MVITQYLRMLLIPLILLTFIGCTGYRMPPRCRSHPANPSTPVTLIQLPSTLEIDPDKLPEKTKVPPHHMHHEGHSLNYQKQSNFHNNLEINRMSISHV